MEKLLLVYDQSIWVHEFANAVVLVAIDGQVSPTGSLDL